MSAAQKADERTDEEKPDERSLTESVSALFPALPFLKDGDYNV